jgi:CRISPR/Cas system-associated exonuclease Cas4 (RecB family)
MSALQVDMVVVTIGCVIALGLLLHLRKRQARSVERQSRPAALQDAELIHIEKTFRMTSPVAITAKLDRAYRLPSGLLVLVELKTRWTSKPSFSDVIQLSAQRVALSAATGQTVSAEAFVLIARPGVRRAPTAHRVDLLSADQVVALVRRREAILADRTSPRYAAEASHCQECAFRSQCEGAGKSRRNLADG